MSRSVSTATPHMPDLAERARRVGVVAHERREIEGGREPRLPLREQVLEARVGLLGRAEAGEHAHRPEAAAVHRRLHAARERVLAGQAEVAQVVDAARRPGVSTSGTSRSLQVEKRGLRGGIFASAAATVLRARRRGGRGWPRRSPGDFALGEGVARASAASLRTERATEAFCAMAAI